MKPKHGDRVMVTPEAVKRWGCTFRSYAGRVGKIALVPPFPITIRYRNGDTVEVRDNEYESAPEVQKRK